jgi:arylsulfatase A-like enzyme
MNTLFRGVGLGAGFGLAAAGVGYDDPQMQPDLRYRAYRDGRWKLVETSGEAIFLFDVEADPEESRNLAGERPDQVARLRSRLESLRAEVGLPAIGADAAPGAGPELDPATEERLRELGYLE